MTTLVYDDGITRSFGTDMFPEMLDKVVELSVKCGRQQQRAIEANFDSKVTDKMVNQLWASYYKTLKQRNAAVAELKKAVASYV
jgi:hypothetical protein